MPEQPLALPDGQVGYIVPVYAPSVPRRRAAPDRIRARAVDIELPAEAFQACSLYVTDAADSPGQRQ